jgi:hypothetical protein
MWTTVEKMSGEDFPGCWGNCRSFQLTNTTRSFKCDSNRETVLLLRKRFEESSTLDYFADRSIETRQKAAELGKASRSFFRIAPECHSPNGGTSNSCATWCKFSSERQRSDTLLPANQKPFV